jgi:lipopolysaccharide transport system ATP-binding protein
MAVAIEAHELAKRYRIGQMQAAYGTLRDSMTRTAGRLTGRVEPSERQEIWALHDVSFTVREGEVLGVIGRNGAGKSTLLKVLTRITTPTSGHAVIRGRVGSLLEVGTGFSGELTGRENVFLNGSILGMKRREIQRKLPDIVEFSGIDKFIDTPVKRYSSGMYVRLAFSVAAHLEPEILLVDEVLAVGDAEFQQRCLGRMEDFGGTGRTVLFVSHNMQTINQLCERAIWLDDGTIVADGHPSDVVTQ